ncbi:MAG TPA: glycosyltransferase family 2 protein [Pyrinomonadaceae bacterium]|nr:glycosyltransferase family 2 protein [Pyrinomonadaceae bacterium]
MTVEQRETGAHDQTRGGEQKRPRASVVIVNWNTRELILQCLDSLKESLGDFPAEIIVVDNDSADGSPEAVEERHPDVRLIRSGANLGFARGNNLGFRHARGDYFVLLNSDTIVLPGAVQRLVEFLDEHPEFAAAGGQHLDVERRYAPAAHPFPSLRHDLSVATGIDSLGRRLLRRNSPLARFWFPLDTQEVDWVSNSFVAVRREVVERVGGLPEEFFLYGDDVEWYWRVRRAGMRVAYVHGAPIIHLENQSSNQLYQSEKPFRNLDGLYTFAYRRRNPVGWRIGWLAFAAYWGALGIKWSLKARRTGDERDAEMARWLRSYARYHVEQVLGRVEPIAR